MAAPEADGSAPGGGVKALHVVPAVAPRYGGPSEAALRTVAALGAAGSEALLATTDADGPSRLPVGVGREVDYGGVPVVFFPRLPGESLKPSPALSAWLGRNVRRFDVVHVHSVLSYPSLAAGRAARRSGVPYVVRPLGQLDAWSLAQHPLRKRLFLRLWGNRLLGGAAALHWTDEEERRRAPGFASGRPGFVSPLGVDEALFAANGAEGRRRDVLFLSRLHPKKNVESLIDAFAALGEAAAGWNLVIAGDGEAGHVAALRSRAANGPAAESIRFAGWLSGEQKRRALREASLFVLPSRQENFGIVVAESLACGTPVVVSDAVALSAEIERAGAGWVAPLEAPGLRDVLAAAMADAGERLEKGKAARRFAEERFRWSAIAGQLLEEYGRLIEPGREPA